MISLDRNYAIFLKYVFDKQIFWFFEDLHGYLFIHSASIIINTSKTK